MSTIVTRAGKGSPLTHTEVDNNFTNLNTDKIQSGNTVAALTITALTTPSVQAASSAGLALKNSAGTTQISMGAGGGDNITVSAPIAINPANGLVNISPTGTGSVTINPATAGTINNMVIGGTTPLAGSFTTLTSSSTTTLNGTTIPSSKTLVVTTDIGSTVQAYDAQLADVAGLTPTDNSVIIGNGTNFVVESNSTLRTSLGLAIGTDVQAYSSELQGATQGGINGFKNRIINGAMVIDQRNAGASVTLVDGIYTLDRWIAAENTDGAATAQQDSSAPTGFTNSIKITTTTADATLGATQYLTFGQNIEGFNTADLNWGTANAKTITISFWVRSSLTGTFGGALRNSANNRSYAFTYTISVADTWEQKSVTIAGDTSGTWVGATNGVGLRVVWGLGAGSTYSGTAGSWSSSLLVTATGAVSVIGTLNANWYITGVQLEKGSTATSFDYRPYGTELALCQRYYETIGLDGIGGLLIAGCATAASQQVNNSLVYKVTKRATPTVTKEGTWNLVNAAGQPTVFGAGNDSVLLYLSSSAAGQVYAQNGSGAYVTISIEI